MDCIDCCVSFLKQEIPMDYLNFITITLAAIAGVAFVLIILILSKVSSTLKSFCEITTTVTTDDATPKTTISSIIDSENLIGLWRSLAIIISCLLLVIIAVVIGLILMVKIH